MKWRFKPIYMILLIVCFVMPQLLIGCAGITYDQAKQYGLDSAKFAVEVQDFKSKYGRVETAVRAKQAETNMFDDETWRNLNNFDSTVDILMLKAQSITQLNKESIALSDVMEMYTMAKIGYQQARSAIAPKIGEFDSITQTQLKLLDQQAQDVDALFTTLVNDPGNKDVTEALTLITGLLTIGMKVIGAALI